MPTTAPTYEEAEAFIAELKAMSDDPTEPKQPTYDEAASFIEHLKTLPVEPSPQQRAVQDLAQYDAMLEDRLAAIAPSLAPSDYEEMKAVYRDELQRTQPEEESGIAAKSGRAALRSIFGIVRELDRTLDMAAMQAFGAKRLDTLGPRQRQWVNEMLAIHAEERPLVRGDDPWYKRWTVGAAQMAPQMAAGIGAAAATGGTGAVAFWISQTWPERYDSMQDSGLPEETARGAAAISSVLESAIEIVQINPLSGVAKKTVRDTVARLVKNYGKELSEEAAQAITEQSIEALAKADVGLDVDGAAAVRKVVDQTLSAAGPLAVLMGAGGAVSAGASRLRRENPAAADKLAGMTTPSRKDIENAGLDPKQFATKKEREALAAVLRAEKAQEQEFQAFLELVHPELFESGDPAREGDSVVQEKRDEVQDEGRGQGQVQAGQQSQAGQEAGSQESVAPPAPGPADEFMFRPGDKVSYATRAGTRTGTVTKVDEDGNYVVRLSTGRSITAQPESLELVEPPVESTPAATDSKVEETPTPPEAEAATETVDAPAAAPARPPLTEDSDWSDIKARLKELGLKQPARKSTAIKRIREAEAVKDSVTTDAPAAPAPPAKPRGRSGIGAAEKQLLAIHDRYKDIITGFDALGLESVEDESSSMDRPGYTFLDTPLNRSLLREVADRLPKHLHVHLKLVPKGAPGASSADGADVHAEIGPDRMAESIMRFAEQGKKPTIERTVEWILANPLEVQPEELYAAKQYQMIAYSSETAEQAKGKTPEMVDVGKLAVGQEFTVAGEPHKVTDIDPDREEVTIEDGVTLSLPAAATLAIDKGSLTEPELDDSFDPAQFETASAPTTNLLGERTYEPLTGGQRGLEFGATTRGEQVTEQGVLTTGGKLRLDLQQSQTKTAAADIEGQQTFSGGGMGIIRPAGVISLDDIWNDAKRGLSRAASLARRFFTSRGDLPAEVFRAKVRRDGLIQSMLKESEFAMRDLRKALRSVYGRLSAVPETDRLLFNEILHGQAPLIDAPEALRPALQNMRTHVDALSQRLIDIGAVEGDLAATVAANQGVYLTRSYRVFDDPKWAESVPIEIRNKAKALLRSEYPNDTDEQIEGRIAALLYEAKAAESPIALIRQHKLGEKDLSILMRRKDIPKEIRALWGEYKDPVVNYVRSVAKQANLIGNHQFLHEVRSLGLGKWLHETPIVNETGEYKTRIAADESNAMHPLNGLYTTPEIKAAFDRVYARPAGGALFEAYMRVNGTVKFSKTVLSLMTQIRNLVGNIGFAIANGHWNVVHAAPAAKATLAGLGWRNKADERAYYKRLTKAGVVGEGARAGELRDVLKDANVPADPTVFEGPASKLTASAAKAAIQLYSAEDEIWKVYAHRHEYNRYRRAFPHWTDEQVFAKASEIVRNTYPTYSMIPEFIQKLRRFPLLGTFVSFPAEVVRVGFHTIKLAADEMKNPATRAIGAERAVGILAAASLTGIATMVSRHLMGVTDDEDRDMRQFLPPWSQNSPIIHMGKDEKGNYQYIDLGYTDPWSALRKPVLAMLNGESWEDGFIEASTELLSPFLGEELLAAKVVEVRNSIHGDGKVFNPQDDTWTKLKKSQMHLLSAIEPGIMTSARRIVKGLEGTTTAYGKAYDPKLEALAVFTGHRLSELDVRQSLSFRARELVDGRSDAGRIFSSTITRRGTVGAAEIIDDYRRSARAGERIDTNIHKMMHSAVRLGVPQGEVLQIVREAGIPEKDAQALYDGTKSEREISMALLERIQAAAGSPAETDRRLAAFSEAAGPEASASLDAERAKQVARKADVLTRPKPTARTAQDREKGITLADKQAAWQKDIDDALGWFREQGIDAETVRSTYWTQLKKDVKSTDARAARMGRLRARLRGLSASINAE